MWNKRIALLGVLVGVTLGIGLLYLWHPFRSGTNPGDLNWSVAEFKEATRLDVIGSVDGTLVITGANRNRPAAWISRDGFNWERSTLVMRGDPRVPRDVEMSAVAGHGDQLVALGSSLVTTTGTSSWEPALWVSADHGRNWEEAEGGTLPRNALRVVAADDGYLALGQGPNGVPTVWMSRDGVDWAQAAGLPGVGEATLEGLAIHQDQIVAVGAGLRPPGPDAAMAWRSRDGMAWEPTVLSGDDPGNAIDVIATDSGFLAVGSRLGVVTGAVAWQSTDGVEWRDVVLTESDTISPGFVASRGDRFVVIAANGVTFSNGPTRWSVLTATAPPRPLAVDGHVRGIAAIGDRYVGIGATGCPSSIVGDCSMPLLFFGLPAGTSAPGVITTS